MNLHQGRMALQMSAVLFAKIRNSVAHKVWATRANLTCLTLLGMMQSASPVDHNILKTIVELYSSANGASSIRLQSSGQDAISEYDVHVDFK